MTLATLARPAKVDQAAALMRLVFEANPGVGMTLRDLEGAVGLAAYSTSTRQRALNVLVIEKAIGCEGSGWGGEPYTYRLAE